MKNVIKKIAKDNRELFVAVIGVLSLVSCAELDPDNLKFTPVAGSFESTDQLEAAVNGTYAALNDASRKTTYYVTGWGGDDITTHRELNKADFREFDQRNVLPNNARLTTHWTDSYDIIRNANSVILRSEGLIGLFDDEQVLRVQGEAHFLRAIAYHQLLRMHNSVPLVTDLNPDPKTLTLPERVDVLEFIEADLKFAIENLPNINTGPDGDLTLPGAPRPNKGSAMSLLSRLYMDWAGYPTEDTSKYAEAATLSKEVIDNKTDFGFELFPNLSDLWLLANRFNTESVFTVVFGVQDDLGGQDNFLENQKYGAVGANGRIQGWDETYAEIRFYEDFPEGPRKEATYRTELPWERLFADTQQNPMFRKIAGPKAERLPDGSIFQELPLDVEKKFKSARNDFFMRYAEVLLIHAEASARSGNATAEAWESLNEVRRRAYPAGTPDATSADGDLAELAFTERKWEFAGEYLRWNDLVRMKRVREALENRDPQVSQFNGELLKESNAIINPDSSLEVSIENYFHPIPTNISANLPNIN